MPLTESVNLVLRNKWAPMDADAAAYITAVETADGQGLEEKTKIAIDNFILGCKADGIWTAIKASCILAGARTLDGALVPLKGAAPTNVNFVSSDYNRKTGLGSNPNTTKYLNSNRNNNADPQDNQHISVYSSITGVEGAFIGSGFGSTGESSIVYSGGQRFRRSRSSSSSDVSPLIPGFIGISRNSSANAVERVGSASTIFTQTSQTPFNGNVFVFARGSTGSILSYTNARLAFYSIGESLDLARLDARVTDLINAIGAAF